MAQQSEASIPRAGKRKWGYDPDQVDEFLEHAHALYDGDGVQLTQRDIQNASFDLTRGGYVIAQVDATLARLERAVVDKQTAREISQHGRVAWKAQTEDLYHEVARHVGRAMGERFSSAKPRVPSYDRKQVDRLADRIVDKCAAELGIDGVSKEDVKGFDKITAEAVANSVFTQRKGKKGYDERQVDYFLNSCVQLLSRIESYGRISDRIAPNEGDGTAVPAVAAVAPAVSGVPGGKDAPLISEDAQFRSAVSESLNEPEAEPMSSSDRFDEVSQAEQSLFSQATQQSALAQGVGSTQLAGSVFAPSVFPSRTSGDSGAAVPPSFVPAAFGTDNAPASVSPAATVTQTQQPQQYESGKYSAPSASIFAPPVAGVPKAPTAAVEEPGVRQNRDQAPSFVPTEPVDQAGAPVQEASSLFAPQRSFTSAAPAVASPASPAVDSVFGASHQASTAPQTPAAPTPAATVPAPPSTGQPSNANDSLASLAHMAEGISQEMPKVEEKSFTPTVPSLDLPSPFAAAPIPSPVPDGNSDGNEQQQSVQSGTQQADGTDDNSADSGDSDLKFDFTFPSIDIPDLSFPTFDNEKKEQ